VKYYPVFLNLKNKKAVVIGGGMVAERKVRALIRAGASVTIISPTLTQVLKKLKDKEQFTYIKRNYQRGDVNDAFLVIAASSSTRTNAEIARDANSLINVIDAPSVGNFIAPSVVRRGPLTIAISTEGASPALSKAIRKEMEKLYDKEFTLYLKFVESVRGKAMEKIADRKKRERFLKSLASGKILASIREKGFSAVYNKISVSLENTR
jgi:precorrin-2 dehydrogenase/sirohydrochlorin ferrochelatase